MIFPKPWTSLIFEVRTRLFCAQPKRIDKNMLHIGQGFLMGFRMQCNKQNYPRIILSAM